MNNTISKLLSLLGRGDQKKLILLGISNIISSILQVISVASFVPFVALLAKPEDIEKNIYFLKASQLLPIEGLDDFLVFAGGAVLFSLVLANISLSLNTWLIQRYAHRIGLTLAVEMFQAGMRQSYETYLFKNTSELSKNILAEAGRVSKGVLVPLLEGVAKLFTVFFLLGLMVVVNPMVAMGAIVTLGGVYILVSLLVRKRLTENGKLQSKLNKERYKGVSEGLGAFKYVKLTGKEDYFVDEYIKVSDRLVGIEVFAGVIGQIPRYVVEIVLFGIILFAMAYLTAKGTDISEILPVISLYALSGYRLVPALQDVFQKFANIRYAAPALDIVEDVLKLKEVNEVNRQDTKLTFSKPLLLRNIGYAYPSADGSALADINLEIQPNTAVAFVGSSGSGKSTLVNLILGLLPIRQGQMTIGETVLSADNFYQWQNIIGYVPQSIFISDASIKQNIAFGETLSEIDEARVIQVAKIARLHDFITEELPQGYDTFVGEKGARLSGGQCQRIGIARALYRKPQILVLDEATSALDTVTESEIIKSIYELSKNLTVIMIAHRLSTVVHCNKIIVMKQGKVEQEGSYQELLDSSESFRSLAKKNIME